MWTRKRTRLKLFERLAIYPLRLRFGIGFCRLWYAPHGHCVTAVIQHCYNLMALLNASSGGFMLRSLAFWWLCVLFADRRCPACSCVWSLASEAEALACISRRCWLACLLYIHCLGGWSDSVFVSMFIGDTNMGELLEVILRILRTARV